MEGLTWEQIYRLLKLRNRNITKNDIRTQNHTAVAAIRDIWHSPEMEIENITTNKDKFKDIFNCLRESLSIGEKYYKFIVQTCEKDKKYELFSEWECFLIEAMHNPKFDLLIPEIHHVWAHEDKTIEMTNYRECQDRVINNINIKFSAQLEERLNSLKEKLKLYGTDRQSVRDTLMKFISTDVNFKFVSTDPSFDIPESIFLGIR